MVITAFPPAARRRRHRLGCFDPNPGRAVGQARSPYLSSDWGPRDPEHARHDRVEPSSRRKGEPAAAVHPEAGQPRAARERRPALSRCVGAGRARPAGSARRGRPRPRGDRVPHPHVLALPRPHPQLPVRVAGGQQPLGTLLGYLLFTPYRWWQRQHSLHHAHAGNLDHRGIGEIYTMTVAEYERASLMRRLGYRVVPEPGADAARRAEPRVPVRAPLPADGDDAADPAQRRGHQPGAGRLGGGLERRPGAGHVPADPGDDAGRRGAIAAWMLYIQHQYEDTYYEPGGDWRFELAALQGSSSSRSRGPWRGWSATRTTTTSTT